MWSSYCASDKMFLQLVFTSKLSCWRKTLQTPERYYFSVVRTQIIDQYRLLKKQYKNYILLLQVGDFYEIYGDDASKRNNITSNYSPACVDTLPVLIVWTSNLCMA